MSLPQAELIPRKAALSGDYSRQLETGAGLAGEVASLAIYGLPLRTLSDYLPAVQAVKAELRKKIPAMEVIPAAKLDLNRGALRKP